MNRKQQDQRIFQLEKEVRWLLSQSVTENNDRYAVSETVCHGAGIEFFVYEAWPYEIDLMRSREDDLPTPPRKHQYKVGSVFKTRAEADKLIKALGTGR